MLESFPVSSSGHVALGQKILQKLHANNLLSDCLIFFDPKNLFDSEFVQHFLHGPTLVVLFLFFFPRWRVFFTHIRSCWKMGFKLVGLALLSGLVTTFFYVLFKFFDIVQFPIWFGFFISGIALFTLKFKQDKTYSVFTWDKALLLGLAQGIAFLPGVSRFALTYVLSRWLKLSPKKSFEISFVIQWPLVLAAFCKTIFFGVVGGKFQTISFLFSWQLIFVLFVTSVVAFFALRFVQKLFLSNRAWIFSVYLLIPFFLSLLI